jgi:hypothetical protein
MMKPKKKPPERGAIRRKGYGKIRDYLPTDPVYIYAFRCEMFIKIGIAQNWEMRIAQIRSHNPFQVTKIMARKIPIELAAAAEHACHLALRAHHHRGEWFLTSKSEACAAIMTAIQDARRGWKPGPPSAEFLHRAAAAIRLNEINLKNHGIRPKNRDHIIDTYGIADLINSNADSEGL